MPRIFRDALLFPARHPFDLRVRRAEAKLAIEPERPGLDRLFVFESDLVGVDGEDRRSEELVIELQQPRKREGRFAFAKGVEDVEADFHPLAEPEGIGIADRNAVAKNKRRESGAQRKTPFWNETDQKNLQPAAGVGGDDGGWIAPGEVVQLAIAGGQRGARHLQNLLSFTPRKSRDPQRRTGELALDRDVAAREERRALIENPARLPSHSRSRVQGIELPANTEIERDV